MKLKTWYLLSKQTQYLILKVSQISLDCSFELLWLIYLTSRSKAFPSLALDELEKRALKIPATILNFPDLFLVLDHEASKPLRNLIRIVLTEYLVHLLVSYLLPLFINWLLLSRSRKAVKTTETNITFGMQLVECPLIPILIGLSSLPLFPLVFIREIHLIVHVAAKSLQILAVVTRSVRILRLSHNAHTVVICRNSSLILISFLFCKCILLFDWVAFFRLKSQALHICLLRTFMVVIVTKLVRLFRLGTRKVLKICQWLSHLDIVNVVFVNQIIKRADTLVLLLQSLHRIVGLLMLPAILLKATPSCCHLVAAPSLI